MDLYKIGLALLAVAVIVLIGRMRKRGRRKPEPFQANLRVVGYQMLARLHPRMGRGCVAQHGLQFGAGFRIKESPSLPHRGQCGCVAVPFNFSSSEVFAGALRNFGEVQSEVPQIQGEDARKVLTALREAELSPLPESVKEYAALVELPELSPEAQGALEKLMAERHEYLAAEEQDVWAEPAPVSAEGGEWEEQEESTPPR